MPPLVGAPAHGGEKGGGSGGRHGPRAETAGRRSASFHGRSGAEQHHQLLQQKRRPKTMPDLLAGARGGGAAAAFRSGSGSGSGSPSPDALGRRTPSKVLVSVAVQGSMWPLHVMAAAEWAVADLVAAAVAAYVREGRRQPLPSADPDDFGLHYSQFSLESLDPKEKVMELGSRSFFLCPKSSAAGLAASSSPSDAAGKAPAWLSNMQFWPMM
ncbi:hypothetical protein U9M48_032437 [Paspalum notatum var. saurae]|uniref:DUF7054 domain-containing protein n=1 Tax=Paspalum notatum var. saurae TaxID=547442 RepID=A0AAQ3U533_PASNO